MFRRRRRRREDPSGVRPPAIVSVLCDDAGLTPEERRAGERERDLLILRAILDEAVVRQDQAQALLDEIPVLGAPKHVAERGGRLASRFLALQQALPAGDDPVVGAYSTRVGELLRYHAMLLATSLDLAAAAWRSEVLAARVAQRVELGPPAAELDGIRRELLAASW